ncbi:MAG: Crp/Fnr family transcriptional regulator [Flavobacteriales bacterium]|nr:Crp/Fnr family transcriptional regulator [Flavobacteriales bacterium]
MRELELFLDCIVPLSKQEKEAFVSLFSLKKFKKGSSFAHIGEYSKEIGFVQSGVLRAFYTSAKGEEYNKTFFPESTFVGAYSSLVSGNKNIIDIDCLTDCEVVVANFKELQKLYDHYPKIERLARILAEGFFMKKEKREIEFVTLQAKERYQIFKEEYPGMEQRIPQYHIASYLGVSPTQLSRIRATL